MNCQLTLNTRFVHEVCETLVSLSYQTVTFVSLKYDISYHRARSYLFYRKFATMIINIYCNQVLLLLTMYVGKACTY